MSVPFYQFHFFLLKLPNNVRDTNYFKKNLQTADVVNDY